MAIELDDEILQDFLIEAEEILENLSEQLVELEQAPQDQDLLNAVFRGFHTIKGGAGFLGIEPLVNVCHRAEDVFNTLRQGERDVDGELMDVVLRVLDIVNDMFDAVKAGEDPTPAEDSLHSKLEELAKPASESGGSTEEPVEVSSETAQPEEAPAEPEQSEAPESAETEKSPTTPETTSSDTDAAKAGSDDEITDEEFEVLLDQLHGEGSFGGVPDAAKVDAASKESEQQPTADAEKTKEAEKAATNESDEITEEEFDALLDQLHGDAVPGAKKPETGKPEAANPEAQEQAKANEEAPKAAAVKKAEPKQEPEVKKAVKETVAPKVAAAPKAKKESGSTAEPTVRVDTKRLDDIMNLVGELVLVRNRLSTLEQAKADEEMAQAVGNLDLVTADLQNSVMKTRMQPIKKVFGRFPRVVRDLARSLNKEINLEMVGEETDLDKNLVEALADPLVHLVRNSVDHGIEIPSDREMVGKPRSGTIVLSAEQEGDHIMLTITDDGAGMDANKLRKIAVDKGIMDTEAAARLDDKDAYNLIFAPGFSTKQEISDISGRGVGMDVVKTRITQLNGSVDIDSELGKGTRLAIKLPLTLAIMPTLMVMLNNQIFALPLVSVVEIFHLDLTETNVVDGQLVVMIREKPLPLFYLGSWLVDDYQVSNQQGKGHVVVVNVGTQHVGLVVDKLIGQEEVVIKPLGALLQGTKGLAGATITGNGRISLILDVPSLMSSYARNL
ncbi:MAG: chemotaxis protein CheW [Gammaproteobacteria bacterium]